MVASSMGVVSFTSAMISPARSERSRGTIDGAALHLSRSLRQSNMFAAPSLMPRLRSALVEPQRYGLGHAQNRVLFESFLVLIGDRADRFVRCGVGFVRDLHDVHVLAHDDAARIEPLAVAFEHRQSILQSRPHD